MSNKNKRFDDQIPLIIDIPSDQDLIFMDQLLAEVSCDHLDPNNLASNKRSQESLRIEDDREGRYRNIIHNNSQNKQKKALHRDIEKLRRQEMAKQYASLRSLLPLQYIKGKRSISDHVNEAANYINHLQHRIKGLDLKRDKLKKNLLDDHTSTSGIGKGNLEESDGTVIIDFFSSGIEILINSTRLVEKGRVFPLSKLIQILNKRNLSVVSCIFTKHNIRSLHTIQCETSDPSSFDISALQLELTDVVNEYTFQLNFTPKHMVAC